MWSLMGPVFLASSDRSRKLAALNSNHYSHCTMCVVRSLMGQEFLASSDHTVTTTATVQCCGEVVNSKEPCRLVEYAALENHSCVQTEWYLTSCRPVITPLLDARLCTSS